MFRTERQELSQVSKSSRGRSHMILDAWGQKKYPKEKVVVSTLSGYMWMGLRLRVRVRVWVK